MERTLRVLGAVASFAVLAGCSRNTPMTQPGPDGRSDAVTIPDAAAAPQATSEPAEAGAAHAGYLSARAALERAEVARAKGDLELAHRELSRAIDALGKDYARPSVEDDTSLKLAAADDLWDKGRREDSISTRVGMLRVRLGLYAERYTDAPREPRSLGLEVAVDQPTSAPNAPLKLVVTLKNTGSVPVLVNKRLALNSPHAPDPMREIVIDVHGPDGELRPYQYKMKMGRPDASHVQTLPPQQSVTHEYELHSGYDLSKPGEYRVSALYESAPVANAAGEPVWTVAVFSKEIRFTRKP